MNFNEKPTGEGANVNTDGNETSNTNDIQCVEPYTVFTTSQKPLLAYACSISAIFSTLALYMGANIGLAVTNQYVALLILRCAQSARASSSIAIAYGIIGDISVPADRGSYIGVLLGFTNSAPSFGPVIGGVVSQQLSWRWIFWLLAITSGLHFVCLTMFLPETSRSIVRNGSLRPKPFIYRSLYSILFGLRPHGGPCTQQSTRKFEFPNPLDCLVALLSPANFIVILVGGITYTIYGCLAASLSARVIETYSLNYLTAGLIYLPTGIGGILAAFLPGKLLDFDYRVTASKLPVTSADAIDVPIEEARLRPIFPVIALSSIATAGYGWAIQRKAHIAALLVVQFF